METSPPILITLTSPSAAGKSYLFNYIRDVAKLPCLISTTTRAAREGEVEGVDYYFIDQEESESLEKADAFAELAIFRGTRYGVTKTEWASKLQPGSFAFLIVEPSGIDHYVKPATDVGAGWLKYYIHTDPEIRMQRFMERMELDVRKSLEGDHDAAMKMIKQYFNRHAAMLTEEMKWGQATHWTRTLFGTQGADYNLQIILNDIRKERERLMTLA